MNRKRLTSAILSTMLLASQTAWATPLTLRPAGLSSGLRLGNATFSDYFDGGRLLPADAYVRSATFVFDFADDDADGYDTRQEKTGSTGTGYTLESSVTDGDNVVTRYRREVSETFDEFHLYEQESARVTIAGRVLSGATAGSQSQSLQVDKTQLAFEERPQPGQIDWYTTYTTSEYAIFTTDWTGSFSLSGQITDRDTLDAIVSYNSLPFSLRVDGDLKLTGARLVLDIGQPGEQELPEPSSAWLALLGGAGLWLRRRARA